MAMVKRGKKYAGQERWERDLADIMRVTSSPRVGKVGTLPVEIGGKAVQFNEVMLLDLLRRRENGTENDSLRSRSYDQGGGGGSSTHTQTEAAALRGLPEDEGADDWSRHEQPDPVGIIVGEALDCIDRMARESRIFEKKLELILNAGSRAKEAQDKGGDCASCGKHVSGLVEDRLKSGYGPCCFWKWRAFVAQNDYDGLDMSHVMFREHEKAKRAQVLENEIVGA